MFNLLVGRSSSLGLALSGSRNFALKSARAAAADCRATVNSVHGNTASPAAITQAEVSVKASRLPFRRPLGRQEWLPPAQDSLGIGYNQPDAQGELAVGKARTSHRRKSPPRCLD